MKLKCGPTYKEKFDMKHKWHSWFAWYPVRVGPRRRVWLEYVVRKGKYYSDYGGTGWDWEYKELE